MTKCRSVLIHCGIMILTHVLFRFLLPTVVRMHEYSLREMYAVRLRVWAQLTVSECHGFGVMYLYSLILSADSQKFGTQMWKTTQIYSVFNSCRVTFCDNSYPCHEYSFQLLPRSVTTRHPCHYFPTPAVRCDDQTSAMSRVANSATAIHVTNIQLLPVCCDG